MRFASDNAGPVHPKVMEALQAANEGWALPYGNDAWTVRAIEKVRQVFEAPHAAVYFTATGSAANVLALATITKAYQTIFCTAEAHIEEDECNAPEFYTGGAKLSLIASDHAKMDPEALSEALANKPSVHNAQFGAVSLTQVTERGTIYTLDELQALTAIAQSAGLPVHLDGARFANAIVALNCSPAEMSWKAGIDIVSFGGTKNGLMGAEAVVIFDQKLAWEFELRRKRGGHLFSKSRYLSAQMDAYLTDDLWLDMARQANETAARLARGLQEIDGVSLVHPSHANMIFAQLPGAAHRRLHASGAQYYPEAGAGERSDTETSSARLVTDWSCPKAHVDQFLALVAG